MVNLTTNCMLFMKMNDNTEDSVVLDASGRNHHGATDGALTSQMSILSGNPPNLTRALNLYEEWPEFITVPHHADFNFGTGSFSAAFWVNPEVLVAIDAVYGLMIKYDPGVAGWLIQLEKTDSNWHIYFYYLGVGGSNEITSVGNLVTGNWCLPVIVHDAVGGYDYIYINGVEDKKVAGVVTNVSSVESLIIGGGVGGANSLKGAMDAAFIFNKALSPEEVSFLNNGGNGTESLTGYLYRGRQRGVMQGVMRGVA